LQGTGQIRKKILLIFICRDKRFGKAKITGEGEKEKKEEKAEKKEEKE